MPSHAVADAASAAASSPANLVVSSTSASPSAPGRPFPAPSPPAGPRQAATPPSPAAAAVAAAAASAGHLSATGRNAIVAPRSTSAAVATVDQEDDDSDEGEINLYEAEARLLALNQRQVAQQLNSGEYPMDDDIDDDMCEEAEEIEEEASDGDGAARAVVKSSGGVKKTVVAAGGSRPPNSGKVAFATSSPAGPSTAMQDRDTSSSLKVGQRAGGTATTAASSSLRSGSAAKLRAVGTRSTTSGTAVPLSPRKRTGDAGPAPAGGVKRGSAAAGVPSASDPASVATTKVRKRRKERKKVLNCSLSKYALIRELAAEHGFVIDEDDEVEKFSFNLIWADTVMPLQKLTRLANWQRFNHFPSMHLLCRKGHLGITLGRMRRNFPEDYGFYPRTWALRSERIQFTKHMQQQAGIRKTYIMKPNAGCQGRGIVLTRDPLNAVEDLENFVVQEYMSKPLLIEGKKFDLRVYVLVTSVRHLSIMVFNDGLVRICAEPYVKPTDSNLSNTCIHLTNYAVNKHSESFVFNTDASNSSVGNKRDFRFLNAWLEAEGHDVAAFWSRVDDIVVKAVIAALPRLQHVYTSVFPHGNDGYTCFEVLGFDVLVDDKLRPLLLEVNHTPSFQTDTPLDHRIKHDLLHEVWSILKINGNDKARHVAREKAARERRLRAGIDRSAATAGMSSAGTLPDRAPVLPPVAGSQPLSPATELSPTLDVAAAAAADADDDGNDDITQRVDPAAVLRLEEKRRKNFRRAYPNPNPALQAKYELLIRGAREASEETGKSTASQEARVSEVRAERERREAQELRDRMLMPGGGGGGAPPPPISTSVSGPNSAATLNSSPSASAMSSSATGDVAFAAATKQWASQLRGGGNPLSSARVSGHTTAASSSADTSAENIVFAVPRRNSGKHPEAGSGDYDNQQQPPQPSSLGGEGGIGHEASVGVPRTLSSTGSSGNATKAPATPPSMGSSTASARHQQQPPSSLAGGVGAGRAVTSSKAAGSTSSSSTSADAKAMRDRLHQQMERHRRRMVLGPRLSVFQLRDTQIEALLQQEQMHQQQQQQQQQQHQAQPLLQLQPPAAIHPAEGGSGAASQQSYRVHATAAMPPPRGAHHHLVALNGSSTTNDGPGSASATGRQSSALHTASALTDGAVAGCSAAAGPRRSLTSFTLTEALLSGGPAAVEAVTNSSKQVARSRDLLASSASAAAVGAIPTVGPIAPNPSPSATALGSAPVAAAHSAKDAAPQRRSSPSTSPQRRSSPGPNAVAVSAAALQSHWLFHYDSSQEGRS